MMKLLRILFIFILFASTSSAVGQCPLTFENSEQAVIGIYVSPIKGDSAIVDYCSGQQMSAASVMKAVTSAAVLSKYSGNYRWATHVNAIGTVTDSILDGNIYITGSGDPTIESHYFKGKRETFIDAIMRELKAHGIKHVTGQVLLENTWPDEGAIPSWEIEDCSGSDGAGFYTLNFKDNIFEITFPSLELKPNVPNINIHYNETDERLSFSRKYGAYDVFIKGKLSGKQTEAKFYCSMPNPTDVALRSISDSLKVDGKHIENNSDTIHILTYQSPSLRNVVRSLMVRSDNQMAEGILRLLAPGMTRQDAIAVEYRQLSRIGANVKNARIADGSGLSRHNSISAKQIASVLKAMSSRKDYVNSFAKVGKDGTVKNFMKGLPGRENLALKSGSMTGVVAYAGYRIDPDSKEPTHVIAILVNNAPSSTKARNGIAEFLSTISF